MSLTLVLLVLLVALIFEYINGFHDTANSIATVVATKVLTPGQAVLLAALTNFLGAMVGGVFTSREAALAMAHYEIAVGGESELPAAEQRLRQWQVRFPSDKRLLLLLKPVFSAICFMVTRFSSSASTTSRPPRREQMEQTLSVRAMSKEA